MYCRCTLPVIWLDARRCSTNKDPPFGGFFTNFEVLQHLEQRVAERNESLKQDDTRTREERKKSDDTRTRKERKKSLREVAWVEEKVQLRRPHASPSTPSLRLSSHAQRIARACVPPNRPPRARR